MGRRLAGLSVLALAALVLAAPAAANGLRPGKTETLHQRIPVNIVLVGYGNEVNVHRLLGQLAGDYKPIVRDPAYYGVSGRNVGLDYRLRYNVIHTGSGYQRRFFRYLGQIGTPEPRTQFQTMYNQEKHNVKVIPGKVLAIDGPTAERWLDAHAGGLGIGANSYTVYLVNWYGHPGFRYHTYTKTDRTDPDTGYNFGTQRASRQMIAWGGQGDSRSWFYDLSAGPESWSNNWNVDDKDVDGDGVADDRMPPVWEYTAGGYKPRWMLSSDLGKVVRYIAVDLLFTTSPLYDPLNTTPGLHGAKVVDINMLEDLPGSKGTDWVKPDFSKAMWKSFEPYYRWKVALHDRYIGAARHPFRVWADLVTDNHACWAPFGTTFAELFCYFEAHKAKYAGHYPKNDSVGSVYGFNASDANMGDQDGLLGYADDNWVDGTQSDVFMFDTPDDRDLGYGFTDTLTHEFGHHIGMSHPHDGYDSASGVNFDSVGDFQYVWTGDESDTVMNYLGTSGGFSRFDRDNMYRWETAGYINQANLLLARINASGHAGQVRGAIRAANRLAGTARRDFYAWSYLDSVTDAYASYNALRGAAARVGVPVAPPVATVLPRALPAVPVHHPIDPIR